MSTVGWVQNGMQRIKKGSSRFIPYVLSHKGAPLEAIELRLDDEVVHRSEPLSAISCDHG